MGVFDGPEARNDRSSPESGLISERSNDDNNNNNPTLNTTPLEALQTTTQRHVLDIIAQLRKCGLESVLSLPQLVVCGDQSSGKSSVLEALTGIPFPRNANLCTRFPTEIILRRAESDRLTIKLVPDRARWRASKERLEAFCESISDFAELPGVMKAATELIGVGKDDQGVSSVFAKDTLRVVIEGPLRPQLALVDLPGIIQSETKDGSSEDVKLVADITERYISQSRTICLPVVSAAHHYANQSILKKVRDVDPKGERTLGIITKPDAPRPGTSTEKSILRLARNGDVYFKLGWHVLKNRDEDEESFSCQERNASEARFFRSTNFKELPPETVGVHSLTERLSQLLFAHVQQELPTLQEDLETALTRAKTELTAMGMSRSSPQDCRVYLMQLSLDYYEVCKAAVGGHYEGDYFSISSDAAPSSRLPSCRLRAVIQSMNARFADEHRRYGHKYHIGLFDDADDSEPENTSSKLIKSWDSSDTAGVANGKFCAHAPRDMSNKEALRWVSRALARTRGKELSGNFNPLVIAEIFWEQSSEWQQFAMAHIDQVEHACRRFLANLLKAKAASSTFTKLWPRIRSALRGKRSAAISELERIMEDVKSYPINYNHYYTDTFKKRRAMRNKDRLADSVEKATKRVVVSESKPFAYADSVDTGKAIELFANRIDPDMDKHACEEVLDYLYAIYKVNQKVFVANVTTQVIERHLIRGLEKIFSPMVVSGMSDAETLELASEPASAKGQRDVLTDRVAMLEGGQDILHDATRHTV